MSNPASQQLDPYLNDLKQVIDSHVLDTDSGTITCEAINIDGDQALQIVDTQSGEMIVSAEVIERVDYILVLGLTPAIMVEDRAYPELRDYLIALCSAEKVIFIGDEEAGAAQFACGVRFTWVRNRAELARLLEHNLGILNRFYTRHGDAIMQKLTDLEL